MHRTRIPVLAALLLAAPAFGDITLIDHPESSGSNPYFPSKDAPDYLIGWETTDQRFGLDAGESMTQTFTLTDPIELKSIFIAYNDYRAGEVIKITLDYGNDGSVDYDSGDIAVSGLTAGADASTPRTVPRNWLEFDMRAEGVTLPKGVTKFTLLGVSEDAGSTSFMFAPQYDITPSGYAGGSMIIGTTTGDAGFGITGTIPDTDNDGLPDPWELSFPGIQDLTYLDGTKTGPGPGIGTGDYDGDGHTDLDEYQNDTDPTNPASPLPDLGEHLFGIDFNRNDTLAAPSQSGFRSIAGSGADQNANATSYSKTVGALQITVSQPDGTRFEFRGANGDSSRAIPGGDTSLSYLVSDFIGTRTGKIDLSIANLPAGTYYFRSLHLEPFTLSSGLGFAQGTSATTPNTIEARIGATLMDSVQPTSLGSPGLGTTFINDNQIPALFFQFVHDGTSPLVIHLVSTESNGTDSFLFLNGFEIFPAS